MKQLKLPRVRRVALVTAIFVLLGLTDQFARANGGYDWSLLFPDDESVQFNVRVWEDGGDPGPGDDINIIDVTSTRGAIVAGTCSLDAIVTSTSPDLLSIRLLEGDDTNGNGTIDAGEWTVLGTAVAVPDGYGGKIATIPATTATASRAAHRIEQTFTWGVTFDEISNSSLN